MSPAEGKKIIAAYLTGQPVAQQTLAQACIAISADAEYTRYLATELGLAPYLPRECEMFRAGLAEFSELSAEARARLLPESLAHVAACQACRAAYWQMIEMWQTVPATGVQPDGPASNKRLAEGISLLLDSAGFITQQGVGPPPSAQQPYATTLSAPPQTAPVARPAEPERKEWVLTAEDENWSIRLVVASLPGCGVNVSCAIEAEPPSELDVAGVRVEVFAVARNSLYFSGRLAAYQLEPIFLPQGSWRIVLTYENHVGTHRREVPLEIIAT
jgi:hypothetical protein